MRASLSNWISHADAVTYLERCGFVEVPGPLKYITRRWGDYYLALVGELFERLREPYPDSSEWAVLGNAIAEAGTLGGEGSEDRVLPWEPSLFAATAFYMGGYSASAYLTLKEADLGNAPPALESAYELLARPGVVTSPEVQALLGAVRRGRSGVIRERLAHAEEAESAALAVGPTEWVAARLFRSVLARFAETNLRVVLPDGDDSFWDPLINSFLNRTPPTWDFFPSQRDAIRAGLIGEDTTYSIQMPTGAGKTALSETLLFYHLTTRPTDVALLLVPYRALAAELRETLVKRLNQMGLSARCAYGGTVPSGTEVRELSDTRAMVATPEAVSGLLSADPSFFARISLVICDEGHLLDGQARGVGLELLLARMRVRESGAPKFVFVSAIVPNIEEINAWLGGNQDTVVRSEFRPAVAEYAVLRGTGRGALRRVALDFQPLPPRREQFAIDGFLSREDFRYRSPATRQLKTYGFTSVKTQAVAAARKALEMGAVAIFAANKRGLQGAVGLAEELLKQLDHALPLPKPSQYVAREDVLSAAAEYLLLDYGPEWIGTRALQAGAVLHHGDIPQETRAVMEDLVRAETVRLAICTNTLAEGVNLPIRTLVLYSVQRRRLSGAVENLLARDIKNLIGRAGRAGATTKGLVICANPKQWWLVEPAARQQPGELVAGALLKLMERLRVALHRQQAALTNEALEATDVLHTLIDGIDATLIDLATEELGEEDLVRMAAELASETFAARQASIETEQLMRQVFALRARRIFGIQEAGRLGWIRETGTRARLLQSVEEGLLPLRERWDDVARADDPELRDALLKWAWELPEVERAVREAFGGAPPSREDFGGLLEAWIDGRPFIDIAEAAGLDIDELLGLHTRLTTYVLQSAIEQGVGLLARFCAERGQEISPAVAAFPDHLRFGVPTAAARVLAGGIRHRRAAVELGRSPELARIEGADRKAVFETALRLLGDGDRWLPRLGRLVLENSTRDLSEHVGVQSEEWG